MTDSSESVAELQREIQSAHRQIAQLNRNMERLQDYQEQNAALLRSVMSDLEAERARSEELLRNILPKPIIERLNSGEQEIADRYDDVTVAMTDFVGFTEMSATVPPAGVVRSLNQIFSRFDSLTQDLGVEKIKTIGDAYMAVAGLPRPRRDHCEAAAQLALGMVAAVDELSADLDASFQIRVGLHTGAVAGGVIGTHKYVFDVWGDTVNTASRLEATAEPGTIHVSQAVERILRFDYQLQARGPVELKGKGQIETYVLTGAKANGN